MIWSRTHDKLIAEKSKGLPRDWIERNGEIYHATGYGAGMSPEVFTPISGPLPRYNENLALIVHIAELWINDKPESRWMTTDFYPNQSPKYSVAIWEFIPSSDPPTVTCTGQANTLSAALAEALYQAIQ